MTKTENLSLPQWDVTDHVVHTDFNEAFATLDTVCGAMEDAAANAQIAYTPNNKPYAVGTYEGTGGDAVTVELGFRPSFLIISDQRKTSSVTSADLHLFGLFSSVNSNASYYAITLTDTGFVVPEHDSEYYPLLNVSDHSYGYIAFR